ncbi:6-deoxyerythronolide-B synthase EryA2, modules 3 and 4-like [Folsomia candida]|uniref:6-deoxyerythronolide-B synthase EryA2, modules 3 and 4-like n=1 Tax=Folsomia candida TaxID=158441 RepID=UPI001604B8FB|nr:6-deoxyerythronolide-B synthase EryA2, modules 3 and 4-like [Folsomia candida]
MPVGSQNWTTLAENDTDAWKCLALVRSLKASISTRHAVVLLSKNVSQNMWLKLQSECKACYLVIEDEFFTSLEFRSGALRYASEKWSHFVWLDCNCLVVNNCDDLFHRSGVQWAKNEDGRVVPVFLSSTAAESELGDTKKYITLGENGRNSGEELDYCHVIDLDSSTNNPLCGKNLKLIYFSNGHPLEPTSYDEGSTKTANLDNDLKKKATELYKRFCPELFPSNTIQPITNEMPSQVTNSIAIVGMACRYPGANSIAEFWELLVNGLDGISKVPERRWTKENALCRMGNWRSTEAGFLFCSIENFDSKFFNTNAADMQFLDPQQRLSLRVVWEALEHARIDPLSLKNSLTGVFGGWWRGDYKELLQMQGALFDTDFLRGYMGNALGPFTARISHFLELIGPSFSTESGCSTSVVGVDMACDSLRNEACNLAIAVGANLLLHPYTLGDGLMEGVLARDGRCKTFDSSADGFGRAEGIGVLILKRYSDAIGDGDRIWGLILGSAVVQEGPSKSMGTPTVGVEAKAMELGLERAGVAPNQVQYVEMHGTGTPIGDPIEVEAVSKAYSNRENILTIGSVKTNIGHTESVCGIASIQKVVLSMHHEIIPEHLHFKKLNPEIDLASIPAQIPLKQVEWKRAMDNGQLRIAGVNSFGITGAQAHVIVQEPPANGYPSEDMKITFHDERPRKIFTISAKTETSFHSQVEAYKTFLTTTDCSLSDIELTMHTGRAHFLLRGIAICDTKEELIASLDLLRPKHVPNSGSKLCFLFTGQGSQYIGMAKSLYEESIVFRSNFELCETILFTEHGISIKDVLWNSSSKPDFMNQTLFSQTSIFCVEFCLLKLWESWGVVPDAVMGHSLGEFVAAVAAGILTLHDALKLVVSRSILIESLPKSGMIVVGADLQTSRKHLNNAFTNTSQKWLDIAAVNSTGQTVMAGTTENIQEFHTYCKNNGVKTHILKSSHAFHSKLLDPILEKYKRIVDTIDFSPATRCTFISAVSGREITSTDSDYWIRHTREKVCFMEASKAAANLGITGFIEVGPQPVLSALLLENIDEIVEISILAPSLKKNEPEWETMLSTLGKLYLTGIKINWSGFHRYTNARKVDVPGYQFDEVPYWVTVKNGNRTHFHPLLGVYVPNASDITIFNNSIDVQRLPFLKDHSLGDKIIYPCAGYLDMCMTSSYVASECKRGMFTKPTSMLTITNFSIITPICLTEGQPIDTQVVVSQTPEGGMCSTIYSEIQLDNQEYKWVKNATAQFGTFTPDFNNLPELLDIKKRCYDVVMDTLDYKVFEEYGFNFGPTLRVMTRVWGNSGGEYLFKFEVFESDEDIDRFIIHPWIVDSMLQAQIISMFLFNRPPAKQLFVPVQIASFAWFGHVARSGYVYTSIGSGYNEAYLFDEDGNRMTCMRGAEFVPTNLSNLLALIDAQKNPLPSMAEYSWRQFLGPEERRIPDEERGSICLKDIVNSCNLTDAEFTQEEEQFYNNLQSLAGLYMIKVAKQLHLDNLKEFKWPQIAETSNIAPKLYTFFRRLLGELVADGLIEQTNESDFKIIRKFQSLDKIQNQIDAIVHDLQKLQIDWIDMELASIQSIGDCLYNIILTDDKSVPKNVEHNFLTTSLFARKMNSLNPIQKDLLTELSKLGSKSVIRILQLGGGIGTPAAKYALSKMVEIGGFHFEYTITDIDKSVATEVENMFHDTGITAKFLQLNLENDPLAQGFIPNYYDAIIVPLLIFHGTQSSADAVENSAKLLKHGGYIFISEIIKPCRHIDMMLGGTGNFELSPITNWEIVLETNGFCDIVSVPVYAKAGALILAKLGSPNFSILTDKAKEYNKSKWIIFGDDGSTTSNLIDKLKQICCSVEIIRNTHTISPSEMMEARIREIFEKSSHSNIQGVIYLCGIDQPLETRQVSEPFLYICKYLAKVQSPLKVVTCTRGNMCIGSSDFDLTAPVSSPIIAMTNVLANENPDLICKCIDIGASDDACAEIFSELFITDIDVMVAYRAGQRWTPRIKPLKLKNNPLMIPKTSRYRLVLPATKTIEDLHFEPCQPEPLGEGEVEIEVKACGLNFRDLFCITKPDPAFANFNTLGVDMAGYITAVGPGCGPERKVGDRVVHCRRHGISLPSHIVVPAGHTVLISNDMTFADAATFPLGYITVVQCLERVAKIDASDIVLIHTASGGVGLIGIQMAQEYGSTIVATAGNKRKRNYLRSLGVKYVFNSRTTNYAQKVRKALGGRGVTVVLNSLTGPGFKEATLSLCEPGARFVEISKMNIWDVEEFEKLRPDVQYNIVDVSVLEMSVLVSIMRDGLAVNLGSNMKTNKLIPLPYVRFDSCDIRQALELMEKTRHVGKIVVTMPEKCVTGGSEVTQKSQLLNWYGGGEMDGKFWRKKYTSHWT